MRVGAASTASLLASRVRIPPGLKVPLRVKIPVGPAELSLRPMMWMFLAILVTFLITRIVTRLIRSGSGAGAGLGDVRIAGHHVHHQVFGILFIIGTGIVLVSAMPRGAALDAAAAIFGVGVGLTVDEFARSRRRRPLPAKARLTASTTKRVACSPPPDRTPAMAPGFLALHARSWRHQASSFAADRRIRIVKR